MKWIANLTVKVVGIHGDHCPDIHALDLFDQDWEGSDREMIVEISYSDLETSRVIYDLVPSVDFAKICVRVIVNFGPGHDRTDPDYVYFGDHDLCRASKILVLVMK